MQALAAADDEHNVVERRDAEVKLSPTYSANHGGSNVNGGASDGNTNTTINNNSGGVASRCIAMLACCKAILCSLPHLCTPSCK
jgi:hypothetical protein